MNVIEQKRQKMYKGCVIEKSGEKVIIEDSNGDDLRNYLVYGKSVQEGTPTPDAPVEVVSLGESGSFQVKTKGKNLFAPSDLNYNSTQNGITLSYDKNTGVWTLNGKTKDDAKFSAWLFTLNISSKIIGKYHLNIKYLSGNFTVDSTSTVYPKGLVLYLGTKSNPNHWNNNIIKNGNLTNEINVDCVGTEEDYISGVKLDNFFYGGTQHWIFNNFKFIVQLELGNVATDYEPYFEPKTTSIRLNEPLRKIGGYADYIQYKGVGKNLFDVNKNYTIENGTRNGSRFTRTTDGQDMNIRYLSLEDLGIKQGSTITVSMKSNWTSGVIVITELKGLDWVANRFINYPSKSARFTLNDKTTRLNIQFDESCTSPSGTLGYVEDIQIELGSVATTYEPYHNGACVVRNIKTYTLTGNEMWVYYGGSYDTQSTALPKEALNTNEDCMKNTHFLSGRMGLTFANLKYIALFKATSWGFNDTAVWKNYLKEQYENGTPVKVYYVLATPIIEPLSLPQIKTGEYTNEFTVSSGEDDNFNTILSLRDWQFLKLRNGDILTINLTNVNYKVNSSNNKIQYYNK